MKYRRSFVFALIILLLLLRRGFFQLFKNETTACSIQTKTSSAKEFSSATEVSLAQKAQSISTEIDFFRQSKTPIRAWFNDPPFSSGGLPEAVANILSQAAQQEEPLILAQVYQLNVAEVVTGMLEFSKKVGADRLKLFLESDYILKQLGQTNNEDGYYQVYKKLKAAGVEIRIDNVHGGGHGQSHNKFMVINNRFVWTGSWNMSNNDTYRNFNHGLLFDSPELAQIFTSEFYLMWNRGVQAQKHVSSTAGPKKVKLGNTEVLVAFAPQDFPEALIINELRRANQSIYIAMFRLTDLNLIELLAGQKKRGLDVRLVLDKTAIGSTVSGGGGKKLQTILQELQLPFQVKQAKGFLHHKFAIIDAGTTSDPAVLTGSYNWTRAAAERNDENLLVIRDPELALHFRAEFMKLYGAMELPQQLFADYTYSLKFTQIQRKHNDLILTVSPGAGFFSQILKHNGQLISSFIDDGKSFVYRIKNFYPYSRSGYFTIEMPNFGVVEALAYGAKNLRENIKRDWLRLSASDYWQECPAESGRMVSACGLELTLSDLCLQRDNEWKRKFAWVPCH